jgi:ketosteroid isomerase-like protein
MSDEDRIREMNEIMGSSDIPRFVELVRPDAVWEHNPGTGSPEEGVYQGRDEITALFARILEGWDYIRPVATEIRELEPGAYRVRGELHCKHKATDSEIVEQYEQRLEISEGLLAKARMVIGTSAHG